MLINAGVKRIVYLGDYPDPLARQMLDQAGVELVRLAINAPDSEAEGRA
jgi:dCMP deaminase